MSDCRLRACHGHLRLSVRSAFEQSPIYIPVFEPCTDHFGAALLGCRTSLQDDVFCTVLQPPQESHHSQRPGLRIDRNQRKRQQK